MRAFKSFLVLENTFKFYKSKISSNLVPGQLSYFCLNLAFFNPLFWSFFDSLGKVFFAKIINLGLYFHKILILDTRNDLHAPLRSLNTPYFTLFMPSYKFSDPGFVNRYSSVPPLPRLGLRKYSYLQDLL